jgi:hypothetical protein
LVSDVAKATDDITSNDADVTDDTTSCRHLPNVDMSKSVAFARLEAELASAQDALKLKEEEVDRLSKIREEVSSPFLFFKVITLYPGVIRSHVS